jgi:hypothetical protein
MFTWIGRRFTKLRETEQIGLSVSKHVFWFLFAEKNLNLIQNLFSEDLTLKAFWKIWSTFYYLQKKMRPLRIKNKFEVKLRFLFLVCKYVCKCGCNCRSVTSTNSSLIFFFFLKKIDSLIFKSYFVIFNFKLTIH